MTNEQTPNFVSRYSDNLHIIPIVNPDEVYYSCKRGKLVSFKDMSAEKAIEMLKQRHNISFNKPIEEIKTIIYNPFYNKEENYIYVIIIYFMLLEAFTWEEIIRYYNLKKNNNNGMRASVERLKKNIINKNSIKKNRRAHMFAYLRELTIKNPHGRIDLEDSITTLQMFTAKLITGSHKTMFINLFTKLPRHKEDLFDFIIYISTILNGKKDENIPQEKSKSWLTRYCGSELREFNKKMNRRKYKEKEKNRFDILLRWLNNERSTIKSKYLLKIINKLTKSNNYNKEILKKIFKSLPKDENDIEFLIKSIFLRYVHIIPDCNIKERLPTGIELIHKHCHMDYLSRLLK